MTQKSLETCALKPHSGDEKCSGLFSWIKFYALQCSGPSVLEKWTICISILCYGNCLSLGEERKRGEGRDQIDRWRQRKRDRGSEINYIYLKARN